MPPARRARYGRCTAADHDAGAELHFFLAYLSGMQYYINIVTRLNRNHISDALMGSDLF